MYNKLSFNNPLDKIMKSLDKAPKSSSRGSSSSSSFIKMSAQIEGFKETLKLLNDVLPKLLSYKIANAFSLIGADLLAHAQPRVPYETGQLRESGRAVLRAGTSAGKVVASGNKDGTIVANLGLFKNADLKKARSFRVDIGYRRTNDKGEDIALWTHEDLLPHDERPSEAQKRGSGRSWARQTGTGPKYLELAFMERSHIYLNFLQTILSNSALTNDIVQGSKVTKRGAGKYTVNIVDPVLDRVKLIGYRNIISAGGNIVQAISSPKQLTSYY